MALIENLEKVADLLLRQEVVDKRLHSHILGWREKSSTRKKEASKSSTAIEKIESLKINLSNNEKLTAEKIAKAIAADYGQVYRKLDPLDLDAEVVTKTIPRPFAQKHFVVPLFKEHSTLTVAIRDPEEREVLDQIEMATGLKVKSVISTGRDIDSIIRQFFGFHSIMENAERDAAGKWNFIDDLEQLSRIKSEEDVTSADTHIQNLVDFILRDSLQKRASDIHIEPKRDTTHVRMRIDGILQQTQKVPSVIHSAIVSRIKLLARMNISEKRRPQDGRIKIQHEGEEVEMRVSSLPTAFGEKVVIRVFDMEMALQGLEKLGIFPKELEQLKGFLGQPHGIILVTGPTGSGKTSTLYSSLQYLNSSEKNVVTIEDPIEMVLPQFNQVGVNGAIDFTFSSALRSILRQDPDVVMVGEIRDRETAESAIQAALTGHLVLSTLHTNDTASTVTRLYDLGIEPYLIRSSLVGIIAQRLLRTICPHCKKEASYDKEKLDLFALPRSSVLKKGEGCENCRFSGYLGRTGIHELLPVSDSIRSMIDGKIKDNEIKNQAVKEGMRTLKTNALKKVAAGETSLEEAARLFIS